MRVQFPKGRQGALPAFPLGADGLTIFCRIHGIGLQCTKKGVVGTDSGAVGIVPGAAGRKQMWGVRQNEKWRGAWIGQDERRLNVGLTWAGGHRPGARNAWRPS